MAESRKERGVWTVRILLDGLLALRNLMASLPASAIPNDLLVKLAKIERQVRPLDELNARRREAYAQEFGLKRSPDGQRYIVGEGDDAAERFAAFEVAMGEWLETPYPVALEPIDWKEASEKLIGLTALHYSVMPFVFFLEGE